MTTAGGAGAPRRGPDGVVRLGEDGPGLTVVLPQHVVGADGSDVLDWQLRTVDDADELETEAVAGSLRALVRHEVADGRWRLRITLDNEGPETVSLSKAVVAVTPGTGRVWAWAAGAAGVVVLTDEAADGLWALSLRRGPLSRDGDDLVWLTDGATLDAGQRVVRELSGRCCARWDEAGAMLPAWLPLLAVRGDEPVDLRLPDVAVVAERCAVLEGPDATEVRGAGLGSVRLQGSFGDVTLDLAFAPSLGDAVARSSRGIARLVREVPGAVHRVDGTGPDVRARGLDRTARRLVVLQSARSWEAADVVRGWLVEGVTDVLATGGSAGPFALGALAGEAQRRDDPQALRVLWDAVPETAAGPGCVLALTRVWAVMWGLGQDPEPVRQALAWLLSQPAATPAEKVERDLLAGRPDASRQLLAALGGGLPGGPVPAVPPWQLAYAVALVSLVGDQDPLRPQLVQAAEVVARRVTAERPEDPDVLAWLLLGE